MALVTKNFSDIITFTRASTGTFFDSAGVLTSAATNAPRFDYNPSTLAAQGLLIEEARTNGIRNNTMVGAVAGTPGTLPTNWSVSGGTGLTREIVGTGTFNGVTYIDIKLSGSSSASFLDLYFEPTNGIAAVNGQTWSAAYWVQVVAGSLTNVSSVNLAALQFDSGLASLGSATNGTASASAGSTWQRITRTHTTNNAATAYIRPYIALGLSTGVAIDITLRIGLPQLELGAFATSVIPTTTTALTRAADVASVNTLSPWFNATESTLYMEMTPVGVTATAGAPYVEIDNGALTERIRMIQTSTSTMQNVTTVANVTSGNSVTPATTYTANTTYKVAVGIKLDDMQSAVNGVAGTVDTTTLIPTGLTTLRFARTSSGSPNSSVWFKRFTYYPRRLSGTELANITA
jgi:hypothetical protein